MIINDDFIVYCVACQPTRIPFYCGIIQFLSEEDVNAIFAVGDLDLDGQIDFRSKDKVIKVTKLILRQN